LFAKVEISFDCAFRYFQTFWQSAIVDAAPYLPVAHPTFIDEPVRSHDDAIGVMTANWLSVNHSGLTDAVKLIVTVLPETLTFLTWSGMPSPLL